MPKGRPQPEEFNRTPIDDFLDAIEQTPQFKRQMAATEQAIREGDVSTLEEVMERLDIRLTEPL